LVGSAQATCHSPMERQQQWQSLLLRDNSCVWECHGWTVQPASCTNTNNNTSVLMVLTGRTLQTPTSAGWLCYTLTLLLQQQQQQQQRHTSTTLRFAIVNDVLTLYALSPLPAVSSSESSS
jgi:hypothetical protein